MLLDELGCYLYEYLLDHLPPSDLAQLCRTSRHLLHLTSDYLRHCSARSARSAQLRNFAERNLHFLLPLERRLYTYLALQPPSEWNRLPLYRRLHQVVPASGDVNRVSVTSSQMFSYLGDPQYAYAERSPLLGRDVVYLKGLSWLIFGTDLPLVRADSGPFPAQYRVRLHLQVRRDVVWKGDTPMVVRVLDKSTGTVVRHNFIHPRVWVDLAAGREPSLAYNGYNDLHNLRIEPAPDPTWYFLVIDNVEVPSKDSQLVFSLDDRQNVFWKSGKSWDFLEIARI